VSVLGSEENPATDDSRLAEHRRDAGNAERPFGLKPAKLGGGDAGLRLKPPVLDVPAPAVERR
jgi:hypothetical protein